MTASQTDRHIASSAGCEAINRQDRPALRSTEVDGFRLAYETDGHGPTVILLHGWPGDRSDWREVSDMLKDHLTVVVPDLRGFGESDKHDAPPIDGYSVSAQARSILGLADDLGARRFVVAGYDVGSRIAQYLGRAFPERAAGIVVSPPLPGVGETILNSNVINEYWYQHFHTTTLLEDLVDGDPTRVAAYLQHFWSAWSAPGFTISPERLQHLTKVYAEPGAMRASVQYYRAGSGLIRAAAAEVASPALPVNVQTEILWPDADALLLPEWRERAAPFFPNGRISTIPDVGHFVPIEAPEVVATVVRRLADSVLLR